jgi:hypothetical protein
MTSSPSSPYLDGGIRDIYNPKEYFYSWNLVELGYVDGNYYDFLMRMGVVNDYLS